MVAKPGQPILRIVLFLIVLAASARDARAQGVGFQGGFAVDPEQAYVGSHFESGELARHLHFRPGIDGAFGSDVTLASVNIDFLYKYEIGGPWQIYQGGGPALYLLRAGDPADTDISGGLQGMFGFMHDSGFFAEFRVGSGRGHNLKLGVGYTLR